LRQAQGFRQRAGAPRRLDDGGRVGAGDAFAVEEAMKLAHRRQPPRLGAAGMAAGLDVGQPGADVGGGGVGRLDALARQEAAYVSRSRV
jgi:hypothetical protein